MKLGGDDAIDGRVSSLYSATDLLDDSALELDAEALDDIIAMVLTGEVLGEMDASTGDEIGMIVADLR